MSSEILCEGCQTRATVHWTALEGKRTRERHLCGDCAAAEGVGPREAPPRGEGPGLTRMRYHATARSLLARIEGHACLSACHCLHLWRRELIAILSDGRA